MEPDSKSVFVSNLLQLPLKIYRLNLETGRRELIKTISPSDPAGIIGYSYMFLTPDAKTYVYGFRRYLSEVYIVENLSPAGQ